MGRAAPFWGVLSYFIFLHQAHGYVRTVTQSGTPIYWKSPVTLNLMGYPKNQSFLNADTLFNAVVMGLNRWKQASSDVIHFNYWQGTDIQKFSPNSEFDHKSTLYFTSQKNKISPNISLLSSNVLGMTQVWYNSNTGEIMEADIEINDLDFVFTDNPADTSGFGTSASNFTGGKSNVFIQNVITHELGHALGLSHSGGLQSTMLFMESPEQAHLGCDEQIAIHAAYPAPQDSDQRGKIQGIIQSKSGEPIFGAHVLALSLERGTALATAISGRDGKYVFDALEPGSYFISAEPFYAGPQALPSFFAQLNPMLCPGKTAFSRSFLTDANSFYLLPLSVKATQTTQAPPLSVHCEKNGGAAVVLASSSHTRSSAPILNSISSPYFGVIDKLNPLSVNFYRLVGISGNFQIHALTYSLYSPVETSLSLLTADGIPIPAMEISPVYQGDSGYKDRDTFLSVANLPQGDYILQVKATSLQASDYPAGPVSLDNVPFIVMMGHLNSSSPQLISSLPFNPRCRLNEEYAPYSSPQSPPQPPPSAPQNGESPKIPSGFCGTIRTAEKAPAFPLTHITAWFLPWILMFFSKRFIRSY